MFVETATRNGTKVTWYHLLGPDGMRYVPTTIPTDWVGDSFFYWFEEADDGH